ncbi:unnamed protein product [Zymoseptoria tritici ST99CH_3D7]|uniref:C3H1-type domain-containing protein n=1 Tax=Zymoseptoria tritici (strain ST99CH_3D7) TaxID=1276538 RepID=A0A1X7S3U9_ZYMT9|nr:unnamed protein product [Zymoseptoria tritici ST99CH_3D7]
MQAYTPETTKDCFVCHLPFPEQQLDEGSCCTQCAISVFGAFDFNGGAFNDGFDMAFDTPFDTPANTAMPAQGPANSVNGDWAPVDTNNAAQYPVNFNNAVQFPAWPATTSNAAQFSANPNNAAQLPAHSNNAVQIPANFNNAVQFPAWPATASNAAQFPANTDNAVQFPAWPATASNAAQFPANTDNAVQFPAWPTTTTNAAQFPANTNNAVQLSTSSNNAVQSHSNTDHAAPTPTTTENAVQSPANSDSAAQSSFVIDEAAQTAFYDHIWSEDTPVNNQQPDPNLPSSCIDPSTLNALDASDSVLFGGFDLGQQDQQFGFSFDDDISFPGGYDSQANNNVTVAPAAVAAEESVISPLSSCFPGMSNLTSGFSPQESFSSSPADSAVSFSPAASSPPLSTAANNLPAPAANAEQTSSPAQEEPRDPREGYVLLSSLEESSAGPADTASAEPTAGFTLEEAEMNLFIALGGDPSPPVSDVVPAPATSYQSPPPAANAVAPPPAFQFPPPAATLITNPDPSKTLCLPFLNSGGTWCPAGRKCPNHHFVHIVTDRGHITATNPPGSTTVATKNGLMVLSAEYIEETQKAFEVHRKLAHERRGPRFECATCHKNAPKNPGNDGVRCTPCFKRKAACEALGGIWEDKMPKRKRKN